MMLVMMKPRQEDTDRDRGKSDCYTATILTQFVIWGGKEGHYALTLFRMMRINIVTIMAVIMIMIKEKNTKAGALLIGRLDYVPGFTVINNNSNNTRNEKQQQ